MQNGHDDPTYADSTDEQPLISAWLIAVNEFYELHGQLLACLEDPTQFRFISGTFYVGQCPTDELQNSLDAMAEGLEQLLKSLQREQSEKDMLLLENHIQVLNELNRQAQLKLALTKLPPS